MCLLAMCTCCVIFLQVEVEVGPACVEDILMGVDTFNFELLLRVERAEAIKLRVSAALKRSCLGMSLSLLNKLSAPLSSYSPQALLLANEGKALRMVPTEIVLLVQSIMAHGEIACCISKHNQKLTPFHLLFVHSPLSSPKVCLRLLCSVPPYLLWTLLNAYTLKRKTQMP
jgi:hypothetical protein